MKETIKIDVSKVLKAKVPKYYRFVPSFLVKWLENIIHQDELNYLLLKNKDLEGVDFANAILSDLDIKLEVVNSHLLPAKGSGKYIFASNHPLGGLDGMALISLLGKQYDNNIKFIVNDMLSQLTPFADIFLPANKVGRQSHEVAEKINAAFMSDAQVITFPAGLCSRRKNDGRVSDLDWTKGFISKSIQYRRDVVPIFFDGLNSDFFYKAAHLREKAGIKFNIEMIYLPGEVFKNRGKKFTIYIGKPIKWETFVNGRSQRNLAQEVKQIVYNLKT